MRLVVDASVLVAEALRTTGRQLLEHRRIDLIAAAEVMSETSYELRKRVQAIVARGHLTEQTAVALLTLAEESTTTRVSVVQRHVYESRIAEATWRIPRDQTDRPTIALALTLNCGIWTTDRDFFGCGLPCWSTDVLVEYLLRVPDAQGAEDTVT